MVLKRVSLECEQCIEEHSRALAGAFFVVVFLDGVEAGVFAEEIVPIEVKTRKGVVAVDKDEHIKPDVTAEGMAKLRPAFKKDGTVTAGNASGINDDAAGGDKIAWPSTCVEFTPPVVPTPTATPASR